ncbi:MAG: NAD(P)H-hydrate dehydratase [Oscillospiraceae bacterium]|nr:NAD(P)H-hydrate dehydratase [Oscillospiraceae bacterium]
MDYAVTPARMRALEAEYLANEGTSSAVLMERAAQGVANVLLGMTPGGALFLCGPGNNGGDGYAAARLFADKNRPAQIWTFSDLKALTGDARENMRRCADMGISIVQIDDLPENTPAPAGCTAVVDALFGTGLNKPLQGRYAAAVRWINACGLPVLAVDMPSGTPELMVRADATVTFQWKKTPHLLFPGRANTGALTVCDIGITATPDASDYWLPTDADIPRLLPPRPLDAHKGLCGHVLAAAGSFGMAGAAALCAGGALRGGAGLVTVLCPKDTIPMVQTLTPCATCLPWEALPDAAAGKTCIAAGPGLSRAPFVGAGLAHLLTLPLPQVWDADALNWLAAHPAPLGGRFILTPHPGEAARLLGCATEAITQDPIAAAEALSARFGSTVLLKGATTVVIGDGRRALIASGTPGMATGGSGDVLTGIIAALLAQKLPPFEAAALGAHLHAQAGCLAAARRGVRSMTAMDILEALRIE